MDSEAELLARARRYSFRARMDSKSQRGEIAGPVFVSGQGSEVEDVTGKRWLDFNSGQMCAALGHNHPTVTAAIREACDTLIHAHSSYFNVQEIRLAERLARVMPEGLEKSLFLQSGSDANEAAGSLTFAGWHKEHGPLPSGSQAIVAPYCYRCPLRQTFPACNYACLDTSFELIDAQSTGRPAAVLTEPLFSAGGVIEPPPGWLKRLQELCSARGMLLILDEEQTGLGKLGTMFACDAEGVVPDMITVAKHFGGGISISAVTTSAAIEEKVVESGFINTHSHSNDPLACAAGIASLDVIEGEDMPAKARAIGDRFKGHLGALAQRYEQIGDVRGRGLLLGIELVEDRHSRKPAYALGQAVYRYCFERGLIFSQRRQGSVLRFVPPMTTSEAQLDRAAQLLDDAFTAALQGKVKA
ncbi:MAG: aminotransferase class III-fold pyridoxal phosphate-dependent enzyme [Alphaproteobacteria bacterium]|nr:MAG: aminotransferase class III-fold pyridoxal phosphate-dependent enzyme [Alphaproteobacteria bacterium]